MNVTDISQKSSESLITRYWLKKSPEPMSHVNHIFVGDVHGDLHQFLAPLVLTGAMKQSVKQPGNLVLNTQYNGPEIIYLGDYVDEWINTNAILRIMKTIADSNLPITFIIGNHDTDYLDHYQSYVDGTLDIFASMPTLWSTLRKEFSGSKHVLMSKGRIFVDGVEDRKFITEYLKIRFETINELFSNGKLILGKYIPKLDVIVSHTSWSQNAIRELCGTIADSAEQVVADCNKQFRQRRTRRIVYTRNTEAVMYNHIVGHTIGNEWREAGINTGPSTYHNERMKKCKPYVTKTGKRIYYFDFGSSAGYHHDALSTPDFVMESNGTFTVSNLPSFEFILHGSSNALLVITAKSKHIPGERDLFSCRCTADERIDKRPGEDK